MSDLHSQLAAASAAIAAGDRQRARPLLMQVVRGNPTDGEAWYLLRQTLDDPGQIADCDRRIVALGYHPPGFSSAPVGPVIATAPVEVAAVVPEKLFEKGIVSSTVLGGDRILEGRPPQTPPFQTVSEETAPIAIRAEMANITPVETVPVPFTLPAIEREVEAPATASAPEWSAGHSEAPDRSAGSFSWVWLGLVVGIALVCVGFVAAVLRGGTTGTVTAPEGTWAEVAYITDRQTGKTQTDFVRVQRSSYTRNSQGIRLTVVWDVRNASTETFEYNGKNKYIVDDDGLYYGPTILHPDYRLAGRHQSYPMTLVYDLPATTDTTNLTWGRYSSVMEDLTYAIRLNPTEQSAQRQ